MSRASGSLAYALAFGALAACTSEASLGYWSTAPLTTEDAAVSPGDGDGDGDAGRDSMVPDGGFVHASPLCLRNPSLDGIPFTANVEPGTWWPPEAWDACWNEPEDFPDPSAPGTQLCGITVVNDATSIDPEDGTPAMTGVLPPPEHGVGYLMLDNLHDLPERTSQTMCVELLAGFTYNFAIDLASRVGQKQEGQVLGTGVLEIFGADVACGHSSEPLWRSPPLTAAFQTHCVSFTLTRDVSVLTLQMPAKGRPHSAILVDNIRLYESCGPAVVPP